jgi:hypothetical protein
VTFLFRSMRTIRGISRVGMMAAFVAATALVSIPAGTAQAATNIPAYRNWGTGSNCPQIIIYGIRGSGEGNSFNRLGPTITSIFDDTRTIVGSAATVGFAANQYPARSVAAITFSDALLYTDGVLKGIGDAVADLTKLSSDCPRSHIVAIGYSQGADVLRRALGFMNPATYNGMSVYLLGDPNFSATETAQSSGDFAIGSEGLWRSGLGAPMTAALGVAPQMPSTIGWWTYCHALDPFCQAGNLNGGASHLNYADRDGYGIAARIAGKAASNTARPTPQAYIAPQCVGGALVSPSMLYSDNVNSGTFSFYRDNQLVSRLTLHPRELPAAPVVIPLPSPRIYKITVQWGTTSNILWQREIDARNCAAASIG